MHEESKKGKGCFGRAFVNYIPRRLKNDTPKEKARVDEKLCRP